MAPNQPPSAGLQFFGFVRIAARTNVMTVELRNLAGERIYGVELEPE
jgi:alkaline phosphatase D